MRIFRSPPRTYPKERGLFGAPGTFGAPFTQNDTAYVYVNLATRLADFDNVAAGCCCGIGALDKFLGNSVELGGLRAFGSG